jgi:uncharacterized protein YjdB
MRPHLSTGTLMMPKHSLSARRLTALLAVSLLTLSACDSGGGGLAGGSTVTQVQIVTLPNNQTLTNLAPTTTRQMFAVPVNSAGNFLDRDVTFASSNAAVFTVDNATGIITAVAGGTAYLRATAGSRTDSVAIGVRFPVATVAIAPAVVNLRREGTQQLTLTLTDTQGATVTGRTIIWTTSDAAVATVSATGLVSAQLPADGSTATITATVNNLLLGEGASNASSGRLVTVTGDPAIATITITGAPANNFVGTTSADIQLTATARSAATTVIGGVTFTWASATPARATVDANGLVDVLTASVPSGTTNITAQAPAFPGGATITGTLALEIATTLAPGALAQPSIPGSSAETYAIDNLVAADSIQVTTGGGTGDVDLLLAAPGVTNWGLTNTLFSAGTGGCISGAAGNTEGCKRVAPAAGWWRVRLWAFGTPAVTGTTVTYTRWP